MYSFCGFSPSSLRARFTPSLILSAGKKCNHALFRTCSFVKSESSHLIHHFSKLRGTQYFTGMAQRVHSYAKSFFRSPPEASNNEPPRINPSELTEALEAIADPRFLQPIDEELEIPPHPVEGISLLSHVENSRCDSTVLDLDQISLIGPSSETRLLHHPRFLEFLPNYRQTLEQQQIFFSATRERQNKIAEIAREGKVNFIEASAKMRQLAADTAEEIASLPEGKSLGVFVSLSPGQNLLTSRLLDLAGQKLFPSGVNPGEKAAWDLDTIKQNLMGKIVESLQQQGLISSYSNLVNCFAGLREKFLGENPSEMRKKLFDSLEKDFGVLFQEYARKYNLPENLWNQLDNLPQVITQKIETVFISSFSQFEETLDNLNQNFASVIPSEIEMLLEEKNFFLSKQFAYLIITKTERGIDLTVYPSKEDPSFTVSRSAKDSPLVYQNLEPAQLDQEFFYRAFTYQAFLEEQGVSSFTLHHLRKGLLDTLHRFPGGRRYTVERNFKNHSLETLETTLMQQSLVDNAGKSPSEIKSDFAKAKILFRFDLFEKGWSYFYHHQEAALSRSTLVKMCQAVQSLVAELEDPSNIKLFSEEERQILGATLWHAANSLQQMKRRFKAHPKNVSKSILIPDNIRQLILKKFPSESYLSDIESIKDTFKEYFGETSSEAIHQILRELFPNSEKTKEVDVPKTPHELSMLEVLGFKSVRGVEELRRVKRHSLEFKKRISFLTSYRLLASLCDYCNHSVVGFFTEIFLKAFLVVLFPGVSLSAFFVKTILDKAALHGPAIILKTFPKPIAEGLLAFLELYREVQEYFWKRMGFLLVRGVMRNFLREHYLAFQNLIKEYNTKLTREGSLNFDLEGALKLDKAKAPSNEAAQPREQVQTEIVVAGTSSSVSENSGKQVEVVTQGVENESAKKIFNMRLGAWYDPQLIHTMRNTFYSGKKIDEIGVNESIVLDFYTSALLYGVLRNQFSSSGSGSPVACSSGSNHSNPAHDEILKLIPYPDFLVLKGWVEHHEGSLRREDLERVQQAISFFESNVPASSSPFKVDLLMETGSESSLQTPAADIFRFIHQKYLSSEEEFSVSKVFKWMQLHRSFEYLIPLLGVCLSCHEHLKELAQEHSFQELCDFERALKDENFPLLLEIGTNKVRRMESRDEFLEILKTDLIYPLRDFPQISREKNTLVTLLTRLIRRLPIPVKGVASHWDEIDPLWGLKKVYSILKFIRVSQSPNIERHVSCMALFVIGFYLTSRVPESCIQENDSPYVRSFLETISRAYKCSEIKQGSTFLQIEQILKFFGLDLGYKGIFNGAKSSRKILKSLFEVEKNAIWFAIPPNYVEEEYVSLSLKTADYYNRLKRSPKVERRLREKIPAVEGSVYKKISYGVNVFITPFQHYACAIGRVVAVLTESTPIKQEVLLNEYEEDLLNCFVDHQKVLPKSVRYLREMEFLTFSLSGQEKIPSVNQIYDVTDYDSHERGEAKKFFQAAGGVMKYVTIPRYKDYRLGSHDWHLMNSLSMDTGQTVPENEKDLGVMGLYQGEFFLRVLEFIEKKIEGLGRDTLIENNAIMSLVHLIEVSSLSMFLLVQEHPDLLPHLIDRLIVLADVFKQKLSKNNHEYYVHQALQLLGRIGVVLQCPNGNEELERIRQLLRDGITVGDGMGVLTILDSYREEKDLLTMDPVRQRMSLLDIAYGFLLNDHSVFLMWKPLIVKRLNEDPLFVNLVMTRLLKFKGYNTCPQGIWQGQYPCFRNEGIHVDLSANCFYFEEGALPPSKAASSVKEESDQIQQLPQRLKSEERAVDLSQVPLNLALLSWFQPLANIEAFIEEKENSRIFKIRFPKVLQLTFYGKRVDGVSRLYSENAFPGYYISERQKLESLIDFSQYLLLENERGENKVIILPLPEAILSIQQMATWANTELTAGISGILTKAFECTAAPIICTLDKKGNLAPETIEGRAYLLLFYMTRRDRKKVNELIKALLDDSRTGAFSDDTFQLLCSMIVSSLIFHKTEFGWATSILEMIYSNNILFSNGERIKSVPFEMRVFMYIAGQHACLSLLKQGKSLPLNEFEELLLYKGIASESRAFIDSKLPESFVQALEKFGISQYLESVLLHPTLSKRYAKLQAIHLQSKLGAAKYILLSNSEPSAQASSAKNSFLDRASFQEFIQDLAVLHREGKKSLEVSEKQLDVFSAYLRNFDFHKSLREAPVELHQITEKSIFVNFWFYLCLVLDLKDETELTAEELSLFQEKQFRFRKTLVSIEGNYNSLTDLKWRLLKTASENPKILDTLVDLVPAVDSTQKMNEPITQIEVTSPSASLVPSFLLEEKRPTKTGYTLGHLLRFSAILKEQLRLVNGVFEGYDNVRGRMEKFFKVFSANESSMLSRMTQMTNVLGVLSRPLITQMSASSSSQRGGFVSNLMGSLEQIPVFRKAKKVYEVAKGAKAVYDHVVEFKRQRDQLLEDTARVDRALEASTSGRLMNFGEEVVQELERREQAVNGVFNRLLEKYFEVIPPTEVEGAGSNDDIPPLAFTHEDSVGRVFDELLQSHRDYHARPVVNSPGYLFKQETEAEFVQDFISLKASTFRRIKEERIAIVNYANTRLRHLAENPKDIRTFFAKHKELSFDEIFSFLIKGEEELLRERTGLTEREVSHLKFLLNLHLVGTSRWDCLFQSFEKALESRNEGGEATSFTPVGKVLATRRAYAFEGLSGRILTAFLVFEARTGMILWSKQAATFRALLESNYSRSVLELIMGSGKTAFGMPVINYFAADKKTLLINIWPKATAPTNIQSIGKQCRSLFQQASWAFAFTRSKNVSSNALESLYIALRGAVRKGEPVNMTKEDLQSLELNFIELLFQENHTTQDKIRLNEYRQILLLIKKQGKLNVDEAHVNFYTGIDHNYPFGRRQHLPENYFSAMERVFNWLIDLNHPLLTNLRDPDALFHKIDEEMFREQISPRIAERAFDFFNLPEEEREAFISYMNNKGPMPPLLSLHEQFEEICLTRGMLLVLLPFSFGSVAQVEFAISKQGVQEFARPAEGNDKPNEDSIIESPYEAYVKSSILYLKRRLSDSQCDRLIRHLQEKGRENGRNYRVDLRETTEAQYFAFITQGADLYDPSIFSNQTVLSLLKNNDSFILAYVRHMVGKTIEFFPEKCSSNSHNFASMAHSFYSCTGTPDNIDTYAEGTVLLPDSGTQGECIALIRKNCANHPVDVLQTHSPMGMIEEMMTRFFSPGSLYSCIIERGALFRGISNREVAQMMLTYTSSHRPDIKGIVFWDSFNRQMILENGSSEPVAIEQSRLKPHERITYFDESHTFAADIPQPPRAKGLVTFGEHTRLDGLFQAILRMRELSKDQSFSFATSASVLEILNTPALTSDGVIEFAARNSKPFRKKENFQSAPKLMKNVIRRALLDQLLEIGSVSTLIKRAASYRTHFIERTFHKPSECFSAVTRQVPPSIALNQWKNRLERVIERGPFSAAQKHEMIQRITLPITGGDYPDEVTVQEGEGISPLQLGQTVHVQHSHEQEAEEEEEIQAQEQQEQTTLTAVNREVYAKWYWTKDFDLYQLDQWLASRGSRVPVHKIKDLCTGDLQYLQEVLPENLLATNNYTPVRNKWGGSTSFIPFLSFSQQPTYQLLVIDAPEGRKLLLLDPKEAHFLRKRLKRDRQLGPNHPRPPVRFAVYDLFHNLVVANGYETLSREELHSSKTFVKNIAQIKFLNGMVSYTEKEQKMMKRWLLAANVKTMKSTFRLIERYKKRHGEFYGSALSRCFRKADRTLGLNDRFEI